MNVQIVVVNYRTAELTIDCLRSLEAEVRANPGTRVVVTDNASGDDSLARIEAAIARCGWTGWVELMPLARNGGFAYGNNAAIRAALAHTPAVDSILLLNPDTIVRPGALAALARVLDSDPKIGIVGSRLEDPDGRAQRSSFRFPSLLGDLEDALQFGLATRLLARWCVAPPQVDRLAITDWVAGACMLVRREVFEQIGLLDEAYFMYYEEVDFCRRSRAAGWLCAYEPTSRVVHLVGQASGVTDRSLRRRRPAYWFESRRTYFLRHHGGPYTLGTDLAWSIGYFLWRCRRWLQGKEDRDPPKLLVDFLRHSTLLRGFST
ncbi:MAG TPA: glycosyltransferase family 2 protein [Pirellulales bacterium]|nr:glycosyltransferase family 2 protein [Pirellulales bacterium]